MMICVKPCCLSRSIMNSITGLWITGTIGFGTVALSGRIRVPCPAARMTAFISALRCRGKKCAGSSLAKRTPDVRSGSAMSRRPYDAKVASRGYYAIYTGIFLSLLLLFAYVAIRFVMTFGEQDYSIADRVFAYVLLGAELFV